MARIGVLTWNLQGGAGLDVDFVAAQIRDAAVDLVALQEIQRGQARRLAKYLGWQLAWTFKHWPIVRRPEGAAILTPHRITHFARLVLRRGLPVSWKRRVALVANIASGEWRVVMACAHLSPHDLAAERVSEVRHLLSSLGDTWNHPSASVVIAGDFNAEPASELTGVLERNGWGDCWERTEPARREGDGLTAWSPGSRAGRQPSQRLDYVFAPLDYDVLRAWVPTADQARYGSVSDHLPLVVELGR